MLLIRVKETGVNLIVWLLILSLFGLFRFFECRSGQDLNHSVDSYKLAGYTLLLCSVLELSNFKDSPMFAVIKTGGKQYRVSQGDKLRVETIDSDEGESVNLDQILMVGEGEKITIGSPLVSSASVTAKVLSHGRGKKVEIVKFRRRKHYRRQMGHRQNFTELEITGISA